MGCLLFHEWKPHYRLHEPKEAMLMMPVIPSLFAGPPFLAPTGLTYMSTETYLYEKCVRCGKKRT